MIKKLVIVFIITCAIHVQAQNGGSPSPYSYYGIGSLKFKGTVENRSMGGLSIFMDSIHLNLRNPAGYAGNKLKVYNNENRPMKFTVGGGSNNLTLKTDTDTQKTGSTTFDYMALSVPMGKFGLGFGLMPYTSVGYKLESFTTTNDLDKRYKGEGGLNKAFVGLGYQITPKLSIGFDASYNFGNIQNSALQFRYQDGDLAQYQTMENNRSDLSGVNFNFGMSYKTMVTDKLQLSTGLTYMPKSKITSENMRAFSTVIADPRTEQVLTVSGVEADLEAQGLKKTDLTLPSTLSFGAGIGRPQKWFAGAEYTFQKTSEFDNPIVSVENSVFVDASTIALGGFYIPNYKSFSRYWERIVYRAGMRFENTGLEINNQTINEFGISFGVGLPVGADLFSNANIGFEIGKRGTTKENLIQENFMNLQISLSLNDRWFQKRKYN
ncbi:membrane protein [Gelidibacter mesophilus]|uniref:membrane protein n=1 Tax=Gelidibacter mesophilus TaxID=169050 RepID=UPI0004852B96|nr:membrane protein [Gelidibacter mesophilus]